MLITAILTLQHSRGQLTLTGETLDVPPSEAERLVALGAARLTEPAPVVQDPSTPARAEDLIAQLATADLATVVAILDAEQQRSKPRSTVIAAGEARLAALDADSEESTDDSEEDEASDEGTPS